MALKNLTQEKEWLDKAKYVDVERIFHEKLSKVNEYEVCVIRSRDSETLDTNDAILKLKEDFNNLEARVSVLEGKSPNEETNTKDKSTAENALADICKAESVKNKKIKLSSLKSRNMNQCDNFSLCNQVTEYHKYNDVNKLLSRVDRWDIKVQNQYKYINKFECLVCCFKTNKFNCWKLHIMSITHLLKCDKIKDLYSYICFNMICKVLFYGPEKLLNVHRHKHLENSSITGIPILMAEVMKRFISKKNDTIFFCSDCKKYAEKPIHSNAEKSNTKIKCPVEYYCIYCRVNFYSSPEMIDYHSLSVEHMTLKCFDKLCSKAVIDSKEIKTPKQPNENKEKSLLGTVENEIITNPVTLPSIVQDISSSKNSDCIEVKNEHICTVQVNKSKLNESHDSKSSYNKKCKQYKRYFKHKMDILKLLRQCNDRIMKTLVYYCNVCDFLTQEKYVWDKHIKTEHSCVAHGPTVHCSTCSMTIVGGTYEEHISSIEHCNLLEFVQSFKPLVNELVKNTDLLKLVDTSILDETSMDSEQNKSLDFSKTNNTEAETLDDLKSVNDCELKNESNSNAKYPTNAYSLLPDKNYDQIKYVKNDEILNPVNCKTITNKIIDGKSKFNISSTCSKTTSNIETNIEKDYKFDEDQAYGEYVTQRLKNIKNSSVKQDIQLEIDYIFYSKVKKLLQKNA